jgi:thiamine kinase-like enzyme
MILYRSLLDNSSEKILFDKALALFNKLEQDGAKRVLSHNDLHQKNILWNKKYYFIDWEYSGLNHPCFDIASLVRSFKLNQSQINELSIGYKVNNKFFRLDVLNPWIEFIDYLEKIWSISLSKILRNLEHKDI